MKLKMTIAYILILIEVLSIFAINILYAKQKSQLVGYSICVPEGMELTINRDITVSTKDETKILKQNTTIYPSYIFPDKTVHFHFGETKEMFSVSWNNFVEQESLDRLKEEADQRFQVEQGKRIKKGVLVGVSQAIGWLIISGSLTILLIKKKKYNVLLILLLGFPIIIFVVSIFAKIL